MHVAILGTGRMGTALAKGVLAAGHTVTFGSRRPDARSDLPAPVTTAAEAVRSADLVVNAIDGSAAVDALSALREELEGAVLLDVSNAITPDGALLYANDSVAAQLQASLPGTRVVKSLNTVAGAVASDPGALGAPSTVFLSGDDPDAKARVGGLLEDLGWAEADRIDLGGVATARAPEHAFFLTFALLQHYRFAPVNLAVVHR